VTARRRRLGLAAGAFVGVLCLAVATPSSTEAAWTDTEVGSSVMGAGEVMPATALQCTGGGVLSPVTFKWTPPSTGLGLTGYEWTVTGSLTGSGVLPAAATSVTLSSLSLLTIGSGTFTLYSLGPGGWKSKTPVTGSIFAISVLGVGLVATCSP
jgi:hypothetical protein